MSNTKSKRYSAELGSRYGLHPNMITNWKRQAIENMAEPFSRKAETHQSRIHNIRPIRICCAA